MHIIGIYRRIGERGGKEGGGRKEVVGKVRRVCR